MKQMTDEEREAMDARDHGFMYSGDFEGGWVGLYLNHGGPDDGFDDQYVGKVEADDMSDDGAELAATRLAECWNQFRGVPTDVLECTDVMGTLRTLLEIIGANVNCDNLASEAHEKAMLAAQQLVATAIVPRRR